MSKPRTGSRWRTLAHVVKTGFTVEARSDGASVFDELVIDEFLHLEQLDARRWWIGIGRGDDRTCLVIDVDRDGRPTVCVTERGKARGMP